MEIANRSTYRGQVTRIANAANDYLQSSNSKPTPENADQWEDIAEELSVYLQRIKTAYESLQKANIEARGLTKAEDMAKECETIAEYEDRAVGAISRLTSRLDKVNRFLNPQTSDAILASSKIGQDKYPAVKLPKLYLKTFSGDHKDWHPYWEQFRTMVHENAGLTGTDKFAYLVSSLKGRAADTIAGFSPTSANYDGAIALLQEEFGSIDKLVDKNMQQLMGLAVVNSKFDSKGLRHLYTAVMTCIRSLNALGIPSSHYSIMLKSKLMQCLPTDLRIDFFRFNSIVDSAVGETSDSTIENSMENDGSESQIIVDGDKHIKKLLKFIKREAESLESASGGRESRNSKTHTTAAGLLATSANNTCFFCKSIQHQTRDCDSTQTLEQRKQLLQRDSRCFRCTDRGHLSKRCYNKHLKCKACKGRHASAVCDPSYRKTFTETKRALSLSATEVSEDKSHSQTTLYVPNTIESVREVYLQTASVIAVSEKWKTMHVRLILDGGSQLTFIKESLAKSLDLPTIRTKQISIIPFGSSKQAPTRKCRCVKVTLKSQHSENVVEMEAIVVPEICLDALPIPEPNSPMLEKFALADARGLESDHHHGLSLLIGADNYWRILTGEFERISDSLTAVNTVFGWTLHGPVPRANNLKTGVLHVTALQASVLESDASFESLWNLEALGIKPETVESNCFTENFINDCIRKKGDYYEVRLPWKDGEYSLDTNEEVALRRLRHLTKRLLRDPSKLLEYDKAISSLISEGIAERVPVDQCSNRIYYMPHRAVYREDKPTTKVRIVFDASAHAEGCQSINDLLLAGANLLPDILKILIDFRFGSVGIVADIEKAFLQILLNKSERDVHRFFWYAHQLDDLEHLPPIEIYRMTRVTFGVTSSPFLLSATLKKHFQSEKSSYPTTADVLMRSFYMDDLVCSSDDVENAKRIVTEAQNILKGASMNLRKWNTNCSAVRDIIEHHNSLPDSQKVLGIWWFLKSDELAVDIGLVEQFLATNPSASKRTVLQMISRFFDPLGFLSPFTIALRILFQQIWRQKLNWDETLNDELLATWHSYRKDVGMLKSLALTRCVWNRLSPEYLELHLFADASMSAYGTAAYIKAINAGQVSVNLLCAKNRVAPLKMDGSKELTLPKLELTAALIAARLQAYICKNCKTSFRHIVLWSDSKIALYWIRGEQSRWKPYIANRVKEIKALTRNCEWRYCPGKENAADLLTRGISAKRLLTSEVWQHGPDWLVNDRKDWPREESISIDAIHSVTTLKLSIATDSVVARKAIFKAENYSSLKRMLRVTAYCFRFINGVKKRVRPATIVILAEELDEAEKYWIKYAQCSEYLEEITALRKGMPVGKKSKILGLNPVLDSDEVLRLNTRIPEKGFDYFNAHPILLPKRSVISELIVKNLHQSMLHSGTNAVAAELRQKFWIIKARQLVKSIIHRCTICKRMKGKPGSQPYAPLPSDRAQIVRPFSTTGVDFAGPLFVKNQTKHDDATKKVYILLFTCATVRAVHLELVQDLTTECCLLAIRRFFSRRGKPEIIYSDNAKTFKRAAKELQLLNSIIKNEVIQAFLSNERIKWKFIVERAPWWGGFYERLVRSVKDILKITIARSTLNSEELQTFLAEAEYVVNSRPLTHVSSDPRDLSPLTPLHFLLGGYTTAISSETEEL